MLPTKVSGFLEWVWFARIAFRQPLNSISTNVKQVIMRATWSAYAVASVLHSNPQRAREYISQRQQALQWPSIATGAPRQQQLQRPTSSQLRIASTRPRKTVPTPTNAAAAYNGNWSTPDSTRRNNYACNWAESGSNSCSNPRGLSMPEASTVIQLRVASVRLMVRILEGMLINKFTVAAINWIPTPRM